MYESVCILRTSEDSDMKSLPNSDCPEHNETDINRPVCVQVGILIAFQKLQRWYVGEVNMTQFSCYLYT